MSHRLRPLPLPARDLAWLVLATLGGPAGAQAPPDGLWHGEIAVGGSSASGSTSATSLNLRLDAAKATGVDQIGVQALVNHGTSRSAGVRMRSADLARLGGRYDRNLGERWFAFGGGEAETNRPGGVRSRLGANVGAGWHLLRSTTTQANVFTGLGHSGTRYTDGSRRSGAEWLLGEESTHALGESSTARQRLVLYPGLQDNGHRATFESSLATAIVGAWTFNVGLVLRYASRVAPGLARSERLLSFGFGNKF